MGQNGFFYWLCVTLLTMLFLLPVSLGGIQRGAFGDAIRKSKSYRRNESTEWAKTNRRAMVKSQIERVLRLGPSSKILLSSGGRRRPPSSAASPSGASSILLSSMTEGLRPFASVYSLPSSDSFGGEDGMFRSEDEGVFPYEDYTEKLRSAFPLCEDERKMKEDGGVLLFEIWPTEQKEVLKGDLNLYLGPRNEPALLEKDLRISVHWNLNRDGTKRTLLDSKNISGLSETWISLNVLPAVSSWYESPSRNYGLYVLVTDELERSIPLSEIIVPMNCSDTSSLPFPNILRSSGMSSLYPLLESLSVEPPPPLHSASAPSHHHLMRIPFPRASPEGPYSKEAHEEDEDGSNASGLLTKMEDISFMEEDPLLLGRLAGGGRTNPFQPVAKKIIRNRSELLEALEALGGGSSVPSEELLRRLPF